MQLDTTVVFTLLWATAAEVILYGSAKQQQGQWGDWHTVSDNQAGELSALQQNESIYAAFLYNEKARFGDKEGKNAELDKDRSKSLLCKLPVKLQSFHSAGGYQIKSQRKRFWSQVKLKHRGKTRNKLPGQGKSLKS